MIIKKIILAIFLSFLVILGSWYYHNQQARDIVSGVVQNPRDVLSSANGRTNIVLLGMGGEGHEGGDLTDSILFVSLDLASGRAHVLPLPRDIWVASMEAKINTAYHYGGLALAKSSVSEILGVPIHYAVALDFQGFVKSIDAIGGLDIVVDNAFDDYKYPIPGKETAEPESSRYEHLHFDTGLTHMDGSTALKFARSRHALGDEGTDFARGQRQAKIVSAFKSKVLSTQTLFNTQSISNLKSSITSSLTTDITELEQGALFKIILGLASNDNLQNISITNYLVNPKSTKPYGGQWVLIPLVSWDQIHQYVADELK